MNYKTHYHVFIHFARFLHQYVVRKDFRYQGNMLWYIIRLFGAPNGVCTSITESKHIRAVKEPWRRSSRNNALFQMLTTNQRLDQLGAARDDFTKRSMLNGTLTESVLLNGMHSIVYLSSSIQTFL